MLGGETSKYGKRGIIFLLVFIILSISLSKPLAIYVLKKKLQDIFPESSISLLGCSFHLIGISFSGLRIEAIPQYDFEIRELKVVYIPGLLRKGKGSILEIYIGPSQIRLNMAEESIFNFWEKVNLDISSQRRKVIPVGYLVLRDLGLSLRAKDFAMEAELNLEISPSQKKIVSSESTIHLIKLGEIKIESVQILKQKSSKLKLFIKKANLGKIELKETEAFPEMKGDVLILESLNSAILDGRLSGNLKFQLARLLRYAGELKFKDIDLGKIINKFNLEEKISFVGRADGRIVIEGEGRDLSLLEGSFELAETGGSLSVRDTRFLKNLAEGTDQPLDILVEGLKDYHYNSGKLKLKLEEDTLILKINLDGEEGKREFMVRIHNFKSLFKDWRLK
jgi:hypothetical protein